MIANPYKYYIFHFQIFYQPESTKGKGILGFLDLFRTPNIRKNTIIIYYIWFSSSIVYYGLTLNSNEFGASIFVYMSIGKGVKVKELLFE